tara:strand:- start:2787 stop:3275 length:489 start_codon:yes stop_codon:yes gene_type:complete
MANINELEQQVGEARKRLADMEAELRIAKSGEELLMEDQEQDDVVEEVSDAPEEQSFADRVEERMSPAKEVMDKEATPQVDKVMIGIKLSEKPQQTEASEEADMNRLYSIVYDENFDGSDVQAEGRMRMMQEAMEDPSVKQMAIEDPEKFALFMYGRNSAIS